MHSDAASSQAILTQTTLILFVQDTCSQSWSQSITKHTHDPDWHLSLTCLKKSCLCKLFWHHRGQSPWAQFRMVFQHSASYSDTTGIRVPRFSSKWYLRTYGKPTCAPSPPSKSPRCCLRNSSNVGLIARHSERGKKARQTEEEMGRQHQEMDRLGVRQVPKGSGKQGKKDKTGCKIICGAPMTLAVKGLMMMMMMAIYSLFNEDRWALPLSTPLSSRPLIV